MSHTPIPWFAHIVNYLATEKIPPHWCKQEKDRFFSQEIYYYLEDPYLFKHCPDQVVCRCVLESEIHSILTFITLKLVVVTLEVVGQLLKSYKVGSFGPLCLAMPTNFVLLVSVVNVRVPCPIVI